MLDRIVLAIVLLILVVGAFVYPSIPALLQIIILLIVIVISMLDRIIHKK